MASNKIMTGQLGEDAACNYIEKIGYRLVCRNYRQRDGEIDIICIDRNIMVFIEVKTRRNSRFGCPAEAVGYHKQRKIMNTAMAYLASQPGYTQSIRFDVIEVYIEGTSIRVNHIENAFSR